MSTPETIIQATQRLRQLAAERAYDVVRRVSIEYADNDASQPWCAVVLLTRLPTSVGRGATMHEAIGDALDQIKPAPDLAAILGYTEAA